MKIEKLNKAIQLSSEITHMEELVRNSKTHKCEWIQFTHGNGSDRLNVCDDEDIIKEIRDLIVAKNEVKLTKLKMEFDEL